MMFKRYDYIFFIEHKDRELDSIKRISKKLKEKGKTFLILSKFFHLHYLFFYKADTYIFHFILNEEDRPISIIRKMYADSVNYVSMNWEELLFPINEEYKRPQDFFTKNEVLHISWDTQFKNFLLKNGVKEKNIHITGNPANEVLKSLLVDREKIRMKLLHKFSLAKNKKWIFLPMNYAWAFSDDRMIEGKIKKGFPEKKAWEYRSYSQKCLESFIFFVENLSKKYDFEIIIRPHPSITIGDYEKIFNRLLGGVPNNVYINKFDSIREWIIASDIVGSSWSTAVWDAYNIGKPVFLYLPFKKPSWLHVWWNDEVKNLKTFEEFSYMRKNNILDDMLNSSTDKITHMLMNIEKKEPKLKLQHLNFLEYKSIFRGILYDIFKIQINASLKYDYFKPIRNSS